MNEQECVCSVIRPVLITISQCVNCVSCKSLAETTLRIVDDIGNNNEYVDKELTNKTP